MKIVTVVGARPQFVKAAVVSRAIKDHNENSEIKIKEIIIHTGQHYDKNMSDVFFEEMLIPKPGYFLGINGLSHGAMTGQMIEKIEEVLIEESPDYVMVYGDTNSTLAGALAAAKLNIPVAHVESGLRSFNRRMPEEINRVMTDHVSSILFCPTEQAIINLKNEGIADNKIHKVINSGDVMLDAVLYYKQHMKKPGLDLSENFILSTLHRAENTDNIDRLQSIFDALSTISQERQIVIPIHPRTRSVIDTHKVMVKGGNIKLTHPVSYFEMIYLLDKCSMVMTDSGGLQKEACFFKKPCITLREETEWIELVENGVNTIAGSGRSGIVAAYHKMKDRNVACEGIYGDGCAGKKIVGHFINGGIESSHIK